jgi:molybdate transport system substrate-binding protein
MNHLEGRNLLEPNTRRNILENELSLIAHNRSGIEYKFGSDKKLSELLRGRKLAIGDPDHVPAGTFAKKAFENLGLWKDIEPNIVSGSNVRHVLMTVSRGEAPVGVVFKSDTIAAGASIVVLDDFPKSSYGRIFYPSAVIKGKATQKTLKFYDFLKTKEVADIIKKHGFSPL